jgi:excisionase family DNA binding protein
MIFVSLPCGIAQDQPATTTYDDPAGGPDAVLVGEAELDELLTPRAVATLLFVDRKTVTRWAQSGKLPSIRTPGGQRRYPKAGVLAIISGARGDNKQPAQPSPSPDGDRDETKRAPETREQELATAVVSEAVAIALEAEAAVTAEAVVQIAAAVAAAAEKAAEAAERARGARAYAAERAAQTIAREAALTATRVQTQADIAASQVARAAAVAVENVLASNADIEPAEMAILLAEVVQAAAEATAIDTSLAAAVVATAVAAAAAGMARTTCASEEAYDSEVIAVADALRGLTTVTAQRAEIDTQGRAKSVAITALEAAAALRVPRLERNRDGDRS